MGMKRRNFLLGAMALSAGQTALAAEQPWSARLLKGAFVGDVWWAGLSINMVPGWKTYWRVPGDGGIAPSLALVGNNLKSVRYDYPLPHRYVTEAGTTIGYKDEVVFPMAIEPVDALKPLQLQFKAFFGVCEEVCIPASLESDLVFDPAVADAREQAMIADWFPRIPKTAGEGFVKQASVVMAGSKPALKLDLQGEVKDVFVEGKALHYFGAPVVAGTVVTLPVSGAKGLDDLKGSQLRVTFDRAEGPLEEAVVVG
jgi:DsbC/DsbD-like thiol-disulfide interchange protein